MDFFSEEEADWGIDKVDVGRRRMCFAVSYRDVI